MIHSPFFALIRKDLKGYFDQPTGYILIVVFMSMLSWAFFKTAILVGETSLRPLFTVEFEIDRPSLPWLLTLFIPAATMRLLSEEQRDGTLETLLTQPIRGWMILLTKFLSGLIFVSVAILATLGIPLAIMTAGDVDWGAAIAQYIGSIFLAASLVSIGLFTSSLTRNQIVAFILGLTLSMILMIMGLEIVAITLPNSVASLIQLLSPITHFSNMARGIIDLRDLIYFVALISTFLSATFLIIRSRTISHATNQYRNLQLGVAGLIITSILVGWFGTSINGRIDLTNDKIFSLSPASVEILDDLEDLLTVEVYMSVDPPVQLTAVSRDLNDFLIDFESNSEGMVKVIRHFPEDNQRSLRKSSNAGIKPQLFERQGQAGYETKTGYLGVVLTYLNRREVMPIVPSIDGFEYRLASLTNKMLSKNINLKKIGFLSGHGEVNPQESMNYFAGGLSEQYQPLLVSAPDDQPLILEDIDILIIASPKTPFSALHRQSLLEYINNGGKVFFAIEPVLVDTSNLVGFPNRHSLADFVEEEFGVFIEDNLVFDNRSNEPLPIGMNAFENYPYWVKAKITDINIGRNLEYVSMPWASTLGIINLPDSHYKIQPFISTSPFAQTDETYQNLRWDSPTLSDPLAADPFSSDLGVTIEGTNGSRIVITGDIDWLSDESQKFGDNTALGLNLIDWLAQNDSLASVRSKTVSPRNLTFSSDVHRSLVRYSNLVGIPLAFIAIGFISYIRRRSKGFSFSLLKPIKQKLSIQNKEVDFKSESEE